MKRLVTAERAMLVALICAGGALLPEAFRVGFWRHYDPGPGLYPGIVLTIVIAISLVLLLGSLRRGKRADAEGVAPAVRPLSVAICVALLTVPSALWLIGFRLTAFSYAFALMLALSPRPSATRILGLALLAAFLALALRELFSEVFRVVLPRGILTGL